MWQIRFDVLTLLNPMATRYERLCHHWADQPPTILHNSKSMIPVSAFLMWQAILLAMVLSFGNQPSCIASGTPSGTPSCRGQVSNTVCTGFGQKFRNWIQQVVETLPADNNSTLYPAYDCKQVLWPILSYVPPEYSPESCPVIFPVPTPKKRGKTRRNHSTVFSPVFH